MTSRNTDSSGQPKLSLIASRFIARIMIVDENEKTRSATVLEPYRKQLAVKMAVPAMRPTIFFRPYSPADLRVSDIS
jgi:hypothetical protein